MPHGHDMVHIPEKVEEWGYECEMDALLSITLFIGHTHVPSGLFSFYELGGVGCS